MKRTDDVVLQTTSQVTVFIIITFSAFLFLAGHNNPGGGFIGGLMSAAALVLLALSYDLKTVKQALPVNFHYMTATGMLIAIFSGMGSFVFDAPFLSQAYDYFDLPLLGNVELATAMVFDLGVYLAVVGVTMTIILSIGEDR
ncbi:Na(+)/H(+) antiporter subunit B [Paenibacillus daejeonensis]|uniref:Na(+)/H(+) antiporter subunit B n=1 Tax=Paenibacillus daejeonensis TaxID=135193 RepID=UPI00036BC7C3|nr:Na(+)/H(+) antiporter subunit B [Paenibacillus daejeonensis]